MSSAATSGLWPSASSAAQAILADPATLATTRTHAQLESRSSTAMVTESTNKLALGELGACEFSLCIQDAPRNQALNFSSQLRSLRWYETNWRMRN
jgi:hypothetical protein